MHTYLILFQNIKDNISVEIGTKKAITNKKPCMLDFAFGSATNKVIQTMNSMIHTSDNLFCSNSSPILDLSVKFASQICHENINKPLDGTYLADFCILMVC